MNIIKNLIRVKYLYIPILLVLACNKDETPMVADEPADQEVITSGLVAPQGIEMDGQGRIWVCEQGTGKDDGAISIIDRNGQVHPFVTGLPSEVHEGSAGSAHHLLLDGGTLWATLGITSEVKTSHLLKFDISNFHVGDTPLVMNSSFIAADVGAFVLSHPFRNQTGETNLYNLCLGPGSKLYLVDAAANAILEFDKSTNELSLLSELPTFQNTGGSGPPTIDAVPTGIVYQNGKIFVSAFTGFPFTQGESRVFSINSDTSVSTFSFGMNGAVDMIQDGTDLIIAEYARFQGSFQPNTSRVLKVKGQQIDVIAEDLNFINGICMDASGNIYLSSISTGEILRLDGS